ncbi:MAG TPA: thioredoxin family protein [Tepidisphaeraceae bacterium]|jgi:peroxiredoxin|nr:thioredoxin family protein [Tepidisphaeraceae bacterium]
MAFTLQLNQKAPDFDLPGVDGKHYSLANFKGSKLLIIVFSCNHCPFVIGSEDRMNKLFADYSPKGVAMAAINSNETVGHPTDSMEHMIQRAKDKNFRFPYLRDDSQQVALAYGALRTPHFYLFDQSRNLRYTGRMDDNPRNPGRETTHELRDALDDLLAGRQPRVAVTNPVGCNVKWNGQERHWMPPEACDLV